MTTDISNVEIDETHQIKRSKISIECENKFKQSMEEEKCKILTFYQNDMKPIENEYDGMPYKVLPTFWNKGARPHKAKCVRYTQKYVEKLFGKENCKLESVYKNIFTMLMYQYNGEFFYMRLNEWLYVNERPHLERVICDFPVPSNVKSVYEQQQSPVI